MVETCYKIVWDFSEDVFYSLTPSAFGSIYRLYNRTTAIIGKLFVFKDLEDALMWSRSIDVILKCESGPLSRIYDVPVIKTVDLDAGKFSHNTQVIREYWDAPDNPEILTTATPRGTFGTDWVVPIAEVAWSNPIKV